MTVEATPPLRITPAQGLAVLHFPSSLDFQSDASRTRHQSLPAVDEKWIFATWMWSGPRSSDLAALQRLGRGYSHVWPEGYDALSDDVALELLEMLLESRLQPDLFSFNSALAACRDHWAVCLSLLSAWRQRSPRPDVVSFNSVLAALSSSGEQGDWQHAIGLLETMRSDLVAPDLNSFNRALDACSGARRWEEALCLVQDLRHEHLHCDLHTVTAVASVCGHAGEQMALAFANDQRSLHVLPDGLLFGSLLLACEKGLQWEIAVQLLEDMHQSTIALDPISSSLAIRACATCNSWALALWVLAHCCDRDPGPRAYLAAVDAVEAGGGASPELFEELCQKAARSSLFS
eukprot:symbB.v1.2.003045.t1/scaffold167.1/size289592/10